MILPKQLLTYVARHSRLTLLGLISIGVYCWLALNSQAYGQLKLTQLLSAVLPLFLFSIYLCRHYANKPTEEFPIVLMLCFACGFRLCGILTFPILEDDFFRFLWDGRMSIETGTPYGWIPANFFNDLSINDAFEEVLGGINHPDVATIYAPVNQAVFALSYLIAPGEVWPLQLIYATIDCSLLLLLLRLAKPHIVMLYAWSPLIIKEFSISVHPDVLGAFFLIAAFFLYTKNTKGAWFWIPICLALATGVKIFALIAVPLLLRLQWRSWVMWFLSLILIALPFTNLSTTDQALWLQIKQIWFPEALQVMSSNWIFNAPFYYLTNSLLVPFDVTKIFLLSVFAISAIAYFFYLYLRRQQLPIRVDLLYGLFFLCIPAINPWYLVWLLPFAVIYPSRWAWIASFTIFLAYVTGINLNNSELELYQHNGWVIVVEFGLIALALLFDLIENRSTGQRNHCQPIDST